MEIGTAIVLGIGVLVAGEIVMAYLMTSAMKN
jgi:hypothetical protein